MSSIGFLERVLWVWVTMSAFVSTLVLALGIIKARTESKSDERNLNEMPNNDFAGMAGYSYLSKPSTEPLTEEGVLAAMEATMNEPITLCGIDFPHVVRPRIRREGGVAVCANLCGHAVKVKPGGEIEQVW